MLKRKAAFKAKQYINANYIKDGKAVISMNIRDSDVFYDEIDADIITISPNITNFIDKKIDHIDYKYEIILKFYCKNLSNEEKEKIISMLRAYYGLEANEKNNELKINKLKSFSLFAMGILFLGLASISTSYGFLIKEILSIAGWVAIWEMVTSILFDTVKLRLDKLDATKLYNAEIIFVTDKPE